jgi:hypothetical protein
LSFLLTKSFKKKGILLCIVKCTVVLWIHIGFNADPDFLKADLDTDPDPGKPNQCGSRRAAPGQTFEPQKGKFYMKNILGNRSNNIPTKVQRQKSRFICQVFLDSGAGSESAVPIRIRIPDSQMNADPGGSGSTTLVKWNFF